jgi:hypothetical protein
MAKSKSSTIDEARAAKTRAAKIFGRAAGLTGVGITRIGSGYGLKVNLSESPADDASLPSDIDGVPVLVEVVGTVRKQPAKRG